MKDITQLYDKAGCYGFVKRKDGYCWIQDGQLIGMDPNDGKRIERYLKTEFINQRTPDFLQCMEYIKSMLQHRAASLLYAIGKKLT